MDYTDFFTEKEIATYRKVKRGSMRLAKISREVAAEMVNGQIATAGKEFVLTEHGMFRLAMAHNSDNSTEALAHDEMGAEIVIMTDDLEMRDFFDLHGVKSNAVWRFHQRIRIHMRSLSKVA